MNVATACRYSVPILFICSYAFAGSGSALFAAEPSEVDAAVDGEGPLAALAFERRFRDSNDQYHSKPIRLEQCKNITELTADFWSKKHVLTDFREHREQDQVGVIVIVKTEYCCTGSRLCAVTTACLEKKSTPLVGRFRVYAGWVKDNPDHPFEEWNAWEQNVIEEYDFIQGPGARVVVMVPTWDGKMYQWHSTATKLELDESDFESRQGATPALDRFLQTAIDYAPATAEPQVVAPIAVSP